MWHSIGASQPTRGQALETGSPSPGSFAPQLEGESSWLPPVHAGLAWACAWCHIFSESMHAAALVCLEDTAPLKPSPFSGSYSLSPHLLQGPQPQEGNVIQMFH